MPKAFPLEFRRDVVAVDFGVSESCQARWLKLGFSHSQSERQTTTTAPHQTGARRSTPPPCART